jgi:hypothetical protein
MTLGTYPEPHSRIPGAPYVREPLPSADLNQIITNQRDLWNGVMDLAKYTSASAATMQAITGMSSGDVCYVEGLGFYRYTSSTMSLSEPFVYPSTTSGSWYYDSWQILLSSVTDSKIRADLIPQTMSAFGHVAPATTLSYSNATGTPSTIISSSALPVTGLAGKTFRASFGGLMLATTVGSYTAYVDGYLTFNDSGPTSSHAGRIELIGGRNSTLCMGHDFAIPAGATTCVVSLMGTGDAAGTLTVTGPTVTQWLQWSVIDIPV